MRLSILPCVIVLMYNKIIMIFKMLRTFLLFRFHLSNHRTGVKFKKIKDNRSIFWGTDKLKLEKGDRWW